jgi:hypothetical protein
MINLNDTPSQGPLTAADFTRPAPHRCWPWPTVDDTAVAQVEPSAADDWLTPMRFWCLYAAGLTAALLGVWALLS